MKCYFRPPARVRTGTISLQCRVAGTGWKIHGGYPSGRLFPFPSIFPQLRDINRTVPLPDAAARNPSVESCKIVGAASVRAANRACRRYGELRKPSSEHGALAASADLLLSSDLL